MKLLPKEQLILKTSLSPTEVNALLHANVQPAQRTRSVFSPRGDNRPFEGDVSENHFSVRRVIDYRNSFLPQITGTIKPGSSGATIELLFEMHSFVKAFCIVWMAGVAFAFFGILAGSAVADVPVPAALLPLAMLAFMLTLVNLGFNSESKKAKAALETLLEGRFETVI